MNRIFVPEDHFSGVIAMLDAAGLFPRSAHSIRSVRHPGELAGCEGATFAYIENHSVPVDRRLFEAVQVYGLVILKFDDSAARARHERLHAPRVTAYDAMMARRRDPVKVYR